MSVLDERSKSLPEAIDPLTNSKVQLSEHVTLLLSVDPVFVAVLLGSLIRDISDRAERVPSELFALLRSEDKVKRVCRSIDIQNEGAAGVIELVAALVMVDDCMTLCRVQVIMRAIIDSSSPFQDSAPTIH